MNHEPRSTDDDRQSIHSVYFRLGLFCFIPMLIYILSYGPYLRMTVSNTWDGFYRPAGWMLAETPLQKPLLWWGDVTGSREEMELKLNESTWSVELMSDDARKIECSLGVDCGN